MTTIELLRLIKSQEGKHKHAGKDENGYWTTQEWLCGGFAGMAFYDESLEQSLEQQIEYLNQHIGHDSIVGECVTRSGWPDLAQVRKYLEDKGASDE